MHLPSVLRRRPSAPLIISLAALFVSLGGVGYAAVSLPANSVGTAQIQNNAVTYKKINPESVGRVRLANGGVINSKLANNSVSYLKIQPGAVGHVRANLNQLQARVAATCSSTNQAISAISSAGAPTCSSAPPLEFGAVTTSPVTVSSATTAASILTKALPGGSSYVAFANPLVKVTGGAQGQHVTVGCTLAVGPATTATQTGSVTVDRSGATPPDHTASIPLQVVAPSSTSSITATVTCTRSVEGTPATPVPTVTITGAFNALQTQSNN
jgi:hypothetical protein